MELRTLSEVSRLMTIGGANSIAAITIEAIGDIERFSSLEKLVSTTPIEPTVSIKICEEPLFPGRPDAFERDRRCD